ncbi:venom carboxylesterase-6-like [Neodiprion fabricii]|uniref:venom carboxylesterase-6-like n=1 Tax=Neodiprion fabricii TaxID=2872261 RepID=UPI001ED942F8|nr:venom carboxylesterase-6-like [Neodiprion fabricii]
MKKTTPCKTTMKLFLISAIYLMVFFDCHSSLTVKIEERYPRVVTPLGSIEGYFKVTSNNKRIEAYEGIPYAKPPIGELRFRVARRLSPWSGVLKAKRFGLPCLQYTHFPMDPANQVEGSEDCLYMNIYAAGRCERHFKATMDPAELLPVIVYIHGGAFQFGSAMNFKPTYLLNKDIILVTFNYRLGPLGFLSTEDATVPGNMGLKDQVIALHWIADNIQSFGGDPEKITIAGHSSGGASVHYHYLTNLTSGLFNAGISLSGTALNCWAQTEGSLMKAKKLASIVGCPSRDVQDMVECLKIRPGYQIVQAVGEFMPWLFNPFSPFGPVVEKGGSDFTFIDRSPIDIIKSGEVQDVAWITGVTSEEGLYPAGDFVTSEELLADLNENWESIAPHLLDFNYTAPKAQHANISKLVKQYYLGSKPIEVSTITEIVQLLTDRLFVADSIRAARLQARGNQTPVRFYYFTYRGVHSLSELLTSNTQNFGVSHSDDVAYVFDAASGLFNSSTTPEDRNIRNLLINLWVSYATKGFPNIGIEWPEVSKSSDRFFHLEIGGPKEISIKDGPAFGEEKFWQGLNLSENIETKNHVKGKNSEL